MKQPGIRGAGQLIRERLRLLRCNVEAKRFDGDQAISGRLVRPENRTKRANTDLMQHPERAERRRWGEGRRIVSGQWIETI
jgi:hypothetical protein